MSRNLIERIIFAGSQIALIREEQVHKNLSLESGIADLRDVLRALAHQQAVNCPRVRVQSQERNSAWLHTLRAGITSWGVAGGKDYTSIKFDTLAMWATVVNAKTGLPFAFIEANYLSRVRTAAITAIATDLLAPPNVTCLAHFGAGKISELLIRAILRVRPSVRRVFLIRGDPSKGSPDWLHQLGSEVQSEVSSATNALLEADLVTTATSSSEPVIPADAEMPRMRHINLIGSNHLKRREIFENLARSCLPPNGYLVADDPSQAALEAGDFSGLAKTGILDWDEIPTLAGLLDNPAEKEKAVMADLTAFKSVGMGLMDLAIAAGILRRMGLLITDGDDIVS